MADETTILESAGRLAEDVLDVLSHVEGVKTVAELAKHFKDKAASRKALRDALLQAEKKFVQKAEQQGLHDAADVVVMLPIENTDTFQEALGKMIRARDENEAIAAVEEMLAQVKSLGEQERKEAARLYVRTLRRALWHTPEFRDVARDILLWGMPTKTVKEMEKREREAALRKLTWPEKVEPTRLDLSILKAQARLVTFIGRERMEMRDDLVSWAERLRDGSMVGVRIYTGAGGSGKTRLAIEAGDRLRERGWRTGFVPSDLKDEEIGAILKNPERMFLVVDYAGSKAGLVKRILKAAARVRAKRNRPLSFVLLDRAYTDELKGILEEKTDPDAVGWAEFVSDCVQRGPIPLPEIGGADRAAIFDEAYRKFREISAPDWDGEVRYREDELPERPLAVMMLALLASQGHRVVRSRDEESVFRDTWNWERGKWKLRLMGKMPEEFEQEALDLIESAMVARTLGRPFGSVDELRAFWEAHFPPRATTPIGGKLDRGWLAGQVRDIFSPAFDSIVPPIVPDPLADWVVRQRLKQEPDLILWSLPTVEDFVEAPQEGAKRAWRSLNILVRIWNSAEDGRVEVERWVEKAQEAVVALGNETGERDPDAAREFWRAMEDFVPAPDRTLLLRPLCAAVYEGELGFLSAGETEERARLLNNLGNALSDLGRREEALAATKEAVEIRRELARKNPDAFLPYLAGSLNNLGSDLSDLGRREEALAATEEAVEKYRQLARKNPDAFLPDLAMSLNNLGAMLSGLGRREEALAATREAVEKYRQLARKNPDAFLPDLAMSLNNLGNRLSDLGRREEALEATEEAVEKYRQLARKNPDAFLPDLAGSLNNLGNRLSGLGRREEALAATEEAVKIRRELARKNPDAFLPYLANALETQGSILATAEQHEKAAASFAEGLKIIQPFVKKLPRAFGELVRVLLQGYVDAAQAAGIEPDEEMQQLLQSVKEALEISE